MTLVLTSRIVEHVQNRNACMFMSWATSLSMIRLEERIGY